MDHLRLGTLAGFGFFAAVVSSMSTSSEAVADEDAEGDVEEDAEEEPEGLEGEE